MGSKTNRRSNVFSEYCHNLLASSFPSKTHSNFDKIIDFFIFHEVLGKFASHKKETFIPKYRLESGNKILGLVSFPARHNHVALQNTDIPQHWAVSQNEPPCFAESTVTVRCCTEKHFQFAPCSLLQHFTEKAKHVSAKRLNAEGYL